ncbi:MAG TPA: DUF4142 domain-containing protein, partial [Geminicoccaceae bacterium]|nr:DUF4142 domain-containing protein [Geminicoccaceae bacterium]
VATLFAAAAPPQAGHAQAQRQQPPQQGQQATVATGQQAMQQQTVDESFIQAAAFSDHAEIRLGQLAAGQAENAEVRRFGQRMVEDHTRSSQQLATIAQQLGVTPPQQPDPGHQLERMALQQKSGEEFDRAYMMGQIRDHQRAVELFRFTSETARSDELRGFAREALPILQEHLELAQELGQQVGIRIVRAD